MKPILMLSLSTLVGCTVGASLPFGGGGATTYYPRPSQGTAVVADEGDAPVAAAQDDDEAPDAPPEAPRGKLACVREGAGNSFSTAIPLGSGTQRGCLDNTGTDVFALTAGPNRGGTIFTVKLVSKESTCAQLFDRDKKHVTHNECAWGTHSEVMWAAVAPNTTIYLRVERQNKKISPYLLEVGEKAIADDEEPNNSWKTATPLALNTPHQALLGDVVNDGANTRDYYQIKLDRRQKLSVVIDPGADDVEPKVTIYDADRRELKSEDADNRGAVLRTSVDLAAGTYYVEVEEYGWGIGYGNGPAGSDSTGAERPTGHYSKPYTLEITAGESTKRKKRVSKR